MILLRDLLAPWFHYSGQEVIADLTLDSRNVNQGDLFVAIPGYAVDGRQYIEQAFTNGAKAVLVHTDNPDAHGRVSHENGLEIEFFQLSRQLSALAAQCYPLVPNRLKLIGVTGTNGKTSVSQFIAQLLVLHGKRAAVMGTIGNGEWHNASLNTSQTSLIDSGNTTADPLTLMRQLHDFDSAGIDVCALEVSSHGLVQARVDAVAFDIAIFTNLTRDHLDYHLSMDNYAAAKKRLLNFPCLKHSLLNLDDATGLGWFNEAHAEKCLGFSVEGNTLAAFGVTNIDFHHAGVYGEIYWPEGRGYIQSPLLGKFNLSNLVAALSALHLLGYDIADLLPLTSKLRPVAGRMECFSGENKASLVVDYAHTPDGLEQALTAIKQHCKGQVWCVFGCGGDRDKGKRPIMGRIAEQFSDRVMITSDNMRSEDPKSIIDDIYAGLSFPEQALSNVDRIQAIKQVIALAKPEDIILLAGKGHETYQEIAGVKYDYNERALAAELAEVAL